MERRDFGERRGGFDRRGGGGGGFGGPRNFGPREKHKAICSSCGAECEVPFKPVEGRAVYCNTCFQSRKRSDA